MITSLKAPVPAATVTAGHEQVSATVRDIIADIRERGDAAVREYSEKFDNWTPEQFRLSPRQIERDRAPVSRLR